jgi:hypothetical protein
MAKRIENPTEKITVTVRREQRVWLNSHPSINISGLLQEAIDERALMEFIRKETKF